ncbi:hypothetical protein BDV39DRAFT_180207 [Aspergillus sergii]|uniref:Uncharacterized protein n=1 Tax=Aspergillus sergii TaxID=1034303 RepID=A0A5N6WVJ7_9EURO|nr:hypothetical protein BDV39DRAFT_180207 [Aspergillus sergii]
MHDYRELLQFTIIEFLFLYRSLLVSYFYLFFLRRSDVFTYFFPYDISISKQCN